MAITIQHIRTLRLKVRPEGYAWLNAAAIEVNQVWNFANSTCYKAARPFAGPPRWLTAFDLDKLTAGAMKYFDRIGSQTIQRVNAEFATGESNSRKRGSGGGSVMVQDAPAAGCLSKLISIETSSRKLLALSAGVTNFRPSAYTELPRGVEKRPCTGSQRD
jgi:hypothetical protein